MENTLNVKHALGENLLVDIDDVITDTSSVLYNNLINNYKRFQDEFNITTSYKVHERKVYDIYEDIALNKDFKQSNIYLEILKLNDISYVNMELTEFGKLLFKLIKEEYFKSVTFITTCVTMNSKAEKNLFIMRMLNEYNIIYRDANINFLANYHRYNLKGINTRSRSKGDVLASATEISHKIDTYIEDNLDNIISCIPSLPDGCILILPYFTYNDFNINEEYINSIKFAINEKNMSINYYDRDTLELISVLPKDITIEENEKGDLLWL